MKNCYVKEQIICLNNLNIILANINCPSSFYGQFSSLKEKCAVRCVGGYTGLMYTFYSVVIFKKRQKTPVMNKENKSMRIDLFLC